MPDDPSFREPSEWEMMNKRALVMLMATKTICHVIRNPEDDNDPLWPVHAALRCRATNVPTDLLKAADELWHGVRTGKVPSWYQTTLTDGISGY